MRSRARTLRLSLLAAAGLMPIACGGVVRGEGQDEGGIGGSRGSSKPGGSIGTNPVTGKGGGNNPGIGTGGSGPIIGGAGLPTCTAPELDPATGLVACREGYQHRPAAVTCQVLGETSGEPPATGGAGGDSGGLPRANGTVRCGDDSTVCDAFDLGYCEDDEGGFGGGSAVCQSGCRNDQDCGPRAICLCAAGGLSGGTCINTDCKTNADCQEGYRCASYDGGCGLFSFACQTPEDKCVGDAECPEFDACFPDFGPRECSGTYECGRPFLVEDVARVAAVVASEAWLSAERLTPRRDDLSETERAALAEHWTRMGQLEHASIAAFARFSLQLLALGAPPELVEDSTRALADETAHARLCFELASAYAGHGIGPGPLDVNGSLSVTTLSEVVDLVIVEGCFGESSAALEALEAGTNAEDPVIAAVYARIAEDEQRHAQLAFRFVRWALEREPALVRQRLQAALVCPPTRDEAAEDLVVPVLYGLLRNGPASSRAGIAA